MDQAEFELQLKVWKNLAIDKQVLMRTATDALKLDPECGTAELKDALDKAIKQSIDADVRVSEAQEHASQAIVVMEKKIAASEKAQAVTESAYSVLSDDKTSADQQISAERIVHANEIKKFKTQIADKDKALKAINKALADTPENVVKKLKTLKKQKTDEANARKIIESSAVMLRKEKRELEVSSKEMKTGLESSEKIAEQYRDLHKLCLGLHKQLEPLLDDKTDLSSVPVLDEHALEIVEKLAKNEDK